MEPKYLPHEIPENIPVGAGDGMGTSIADVGSLRRKLSECQRQLAEYKRLFEEAQKQEPAVPENVMKFLRELKDQIPEKPDHWCSCSQCERNSEDAEELLEALAAAPIPAQRSEQPAQARVVVPECFGNDDCTTALMMACPYSEQCSKAANRVAAMLAAAPKMEGGE